MIIGTVEPAKDLVNKELLAFRSYEEDMKEIKCPFRWTWKKHETMFYTIGFLLVKFLRLLVLKKSLKGSFPWLESSLI
jgi:hypothetical protein